MATLRGIFQSCLTLFLQPNFSVMNNKSTFASFILLFASGVLQAQQEYNVCEPPTAYTTIHANNIKAGLLNGGDLFWDFNDAQFIPNPTPAGPNPATIFAAGLWLGGLDPGGNLKLATATYRAGGGIDYWAGPLDESGITDALTCSNWDRFFRAKGADIKVFLDDLPNLAGDPAAAIMAYKDIMGWPGRGNPYFADVWGFGLPSTSQSLAAFHDANTDGLYDPLQGDYPVVQLEDKPAFVPAEMVWCVFNDQGGGAEHSASEGGVFQVEIQLSVWAFNCYDQTVLNNTLFTAHKVINRATESYDSCFLGLWVDFDIGCYTDDYFGSTPDLDAFFGYNQDVNDGTTGTVCDQGIPTFGNTPPVQSAIMLNRPMDKFIHYYNTATTWPSGSSEPYSPLEYYRYLTGYWRDGTPLTYGGSGYNPGNSISADHAFPDDPADPNGWTMCTANLAFSDRRVLASSKIPHFAPGQIEELVTAWTVHPNPNLPCDLGQTFDEIAFLQNEYDNNFSSACSGLTATQELAEAQINIFPNPASESITLTYGDLPVREIRLYAADGKLAQMLQNIQSERTAFNVAGLNSGFYTVQLLTDKGIAIKKIAVFR